MVAARNLLVVLVAVVVAASGCAPGLTPGATRSQVPVSAEPTTPALVTTTPTQGACIEGEPYANGSLVRFDGSCYGWRLAPDEVLAAEGLDRNLQVACEPKMFGNDHPTDLDIETGYLPGGARVDNVVKWACGGVGLSVYQQMTFGETYPGSHVEIERALWGSMSMTLNAAPGSVTSCEVNGKPAVCVDYVDHATSDLDGRARIIVIEDGTLDPHAVVLRVWGEEIPFAEVMKIAEGVLGD